MVAVIGAFTASSCNAAIKNTKTQTYKVWGNCDMCKETIETAANKKNIAKVEWNKDTKIASITFDSLQTNADEILKRIAYAGYDNEKFYAPDEAYINLPGCCQYIRPKKETSENTNTQTNNQETTTNTIDSISIFVVNPLADVYTAYFGLKEALTKDNGKTASEKAKELLNALNAVKMEAMETDQHTVFMKYVEELKFDAEHISKTTDVSHQRDHLPSLSKHMYEVMKVIKPETTVYYDFCPMYDDGKGAYWLSTESTIKNPYYGSQMLTCGKVKETIK